MLFFLKLIYGEPMLWPLEQAADVMKFWRDFILTAPEEINGWFAFLTVPPAPPFPEQLHMQKMCAIVWCSTTDRNFLLIEKKEKLNGHHYHIDSICCTCSSSPTLGSQQH